MYIYVDWSLVGFLIGNVLMLELLTFNMYLSMWHTQIIRIQSMIYVLNHTSGLQMNINISKNTCMFLVI